MANFVRNRFNDIKKTGKPKRKLWNNSNIWPELEVSNINLLLNCVAGYIILYNIRKLSKSAKNTLFIKTCTCFQTPDVLWRKNTFKKLSRDDYFFGFCMKIVFTLRASETCSNISRAETFSLRWKSKNQTRPARLTKN